MDTLRRSALKLGLELTPDQIERFEIYYRELIDWNNRVNLTSISGYEEVQLKHFLDSLTITLALEKPSGTNLKVIDVGSGAGLPGIPLKIVLPQIELVLLEATGKKTAFLEHLTQKLGLADVEIVTGRAEEVGHGARYRERFDVALSRAVAPLSVLTELTLPFCAVSGCLIAQKKGDIDSEIEEADKAIHLLGGKIHEVKKIELAELADKRFLVIIDKVSPSPPQYPRRPGIPAKRPLK